MDRTLASNDEPTGFSHPGWRVAYTTMSWFIMGWAVGPGKGSFVALLLFAWQLLTDYLKFTPRLRFRKWTRRIGLTWAVIAVFLSVFGLVGILSLQGNQHFPDLWVQNFVILSGDHIPFLVLWGFIGISVVASGADWSSETRELEFIRKIKAEDLAKKQLQETTLSVASTSAQLENDAQ